MIEDVRAFHRKFGLLNPNVPVHLTRKKLAERANFMLEELKEFADAAGLTFDPDCAEFVPRILDRDQNLPLQADALVDLVYVALGTAVQMDLPWRELWDDVQRANMQKVRGESDRAYIDVIKPSGWVPPKTDDILARAGYDRAGWVDENDVVIDEVCVGDP